MSEVVASAQVNWVIDLESNAAEVPIEKLAGSYGTDHRANTVRSGECQSILMSRYKDLHVTKSNLQFVKAIDGFEG
jgi:hypothetical protein